VVHHIDSLIQSLGPFGYLVLGLAALIEYLFPPFPGDSITLLGGAYVARDERSMPLVILALTLGSMGGIAVTWLLGFAIAGKVSTLDENKTILGLKVGQLRKAQALMLEKGAWLLVSNRFIPSFRAIVFVAAGASGVPLSRALFLGVVSALAWNTLLVTVGFTFGDNAERIERFFVTYRNTALVLVGLVALGLVARALWRRSRAPP
jgi:membrane protein DedA with SNARE-associated domain